MLPISVHIPHYASSTIIKTQNCLGELIQNTKQIRNFSISATPMLETLMLKSLMAYFAFQALGPLYGDRSEIFPNHFLQALLFSPQNLCIFVFLIFQQGLPKLSWHRKIIFGSKLYRTERAQFNLSRFTNISQRQQYAIICWTKKLLCAHLHQISITNLFTKLWYNYIYSSILKQEGLHRTGI